VALNLIAASGVTRKANFLYIWIIPIVLNGTADHLGKVTPGSPDKHEVFGWGRKKEGSQQAPLKG